MHCNTSLNYYCGTREFEEVCVTRVGKQKIRRCKQYFILDEINKAPILSSLGVECCIIVHKDVYLVYKGNISFPLSIGFPTI